MSYFMSLNPLSLFRAMPGSIAQGMIWGVMALGVYITFRLLDFADLTVDGSIATGAAVSVMLIRAGVSPIATLPIAFACCTLVINPFKIPFTDKLSIQVIFFRYQIAFPF